ncbi:hypothetical protein HUJ05_001728 [Dendroctonus ponderosae]|nr:hypothetical protein HUJ05_001728 [Dendroctonus ponderosae]
MNATYKVEQLQSQLDKIHKMYEELNIKYSNIEKKLPSKAKERGTGEYHTNEEELARETESIRTKNWKKRNMDTSLTPPQQQTNSMGHEGNTWLHLQTECGYRIVHYAGIASLFQLVRQLQGKTNYVLLGTDEIAFFMVSRDGNVALERPHESSACYKEKHAVTDIRATTDNAADKKINYLIGVGYRSHH